MKKKLSAILLTIVLLFQIVPVQATEFSGTHLYYAINDIINFVSTNYHFGVSDAQLLRAVMEDAAKNNGGLISFDRAMDAIFEELDTYSEYYNAEDYQALMESTYGSFSGIGITYLMQNGTILVTEVFEGGPAHEAGILAGDTIVSVDGRPVSDMLQGEVVNAIRGETGTTVQIGIQHGDTAVTVSVVRAEVETQELYSQMIPGENIGYIAITGFNANTAEKLDVAMKEFKAAGVKKLIIDLRDNPGGVMATVLSCLDLLVPHGKTVLNVKYKDDEEVYKSQKKTTRKEFELAVLVNEGSASASEVFAGAIKDTKTGVIVGDRTYGKGTIQHLVRLNTGAGIKVTIGEFFTPAGNTIRGEGVMPDVLVQNEIKTISETDLDQMNLFGTFQDGVSDPSVVGIEERLEVLGYFTEVPDENYTQETAFAVKQFQFMMGLPMNGIADTKTMVALNDIEYKYYVYEADHQLEAAINELK